MLSIRIQTHDKRENTKHKHRCGHSAKCCKLCVKLTHQLSCLSIGHSASHMRACCAHQHTPYLAREPLWVALRGWVKAQLECIVPVTHVRLA